ncbi:MAG: GNAT family protein [Bacteroidales bacterium]|nr:GNAT family protein [Bacteroidales bacterium]MDY0141972.1 GNAT family protein [Bacteroidales bacterium]
MKQTTEIRCSENLKLRLLTNNDVEDIFEAISAQRCYQGAWLTISNDNLRVEAKEYVKYVTEQKDNILDLIYVIEYDNVFAGLLGLQKIDNQNHKAEYTCWVQEKYQYLDILAEASSKFIEHYFKDLKFNRLEIRATWDNIKVKDIARRFGFIEEGVEKQSQFIGDEKYKDVIIYGLLRHEYQTKLMFYRHSTKLRTDI